MRSGDIRDRSLKLYEIAPNFGQFLPSQILGEGRGLPPPQKKKIVHPHCHACLAVRQVDKFREVTSPGLKVITVNTVR